MIFVKQVASLYCDIKARGCEQHTVAEGRDQKAWLADARAQGWTVNISKRIVRCPSCRYVRDPKRMNQP